jgi:hypothetical protein
VFCWTLQAEEYRPLLTTLFSRYVDPCLEHCKKSYKTVVPLPAVNQVCRLCIACLRLVGCWPQLHAAQAAGDVLKSHVAAPKTLEPGLLSWWL